MSDLLEILRAHLGIDALERPALFAAALLIAALAVSSAARRPPSALPWPGWPEARAAGARPHDPARLAALALRAVALALVGLALAGPVRVHRSPPPPGEGLDLLLAVDASGSMRALDAEVGGAWRTRLDLARQAVARFAVHRVAAGDRVGLVVFGRGALTQCPLTSDGRLLAAALERVEAGMAGEATALGDALALAVRRVAGAGPAPARAPGPVAGRLVVLLSDGRSNAGAVPPDVAAAIALAEGVRVHTVGIGSRGEVPMERAERAAQPGPRFERHDLDEDTLRQVAAATGGRFFRARSSHDLDAVYAEIDALERVPRRARPRERRAPHPQPFLALAGTLLALELVAARGLARRLP